MKKKKESGYFACLASQHAKQTICIGKPKVDAAAKHTEKTL